MTKRITLALLLGVACSSKPPPQPLPPLQLPSGCNPLLAGYNCFLPYPTDFFRVADAGSPTGYLIQPSGAAVLREPATGTTPGASADVGEFRSIDGFSTLPAVQAVLPAAISPSGFVGLFDNPDASIAPTSNMLLLEASTGQAIPSFVDLDPRALMPDGGGDPEHQAITLHPYVPLAYATRYVVALQGVQAVDGGLVPAPEGFRRLRDEQSAGDPVLGPMQTHYDQDVFPVIEDAGISRANLQLAWDFTTGDEGQVDGDMFQIRDLTLQWLSQNTPQVTISSVQENDGGDNWYVAQGSVTGQTCVKLQGGDCGDDSWRVVEGTVQGPLFETSGEPGSRINYGPDGKVAQNGLTTFTFIANVPISVRDQFGPGRTVSYGHGFFGSQSEVVYGNTRAIAQVLGGVFFGIDWWGMSLADAPVLGNDIVSFPSEMLLFSDRVPQAMANWIVMDAAIRAPLMQQTAFQRPASGPGTSTQGGQSNAGQALYQGFTNYYLGISQGAILGGVLAALSPDFEQIVLNVGGAGFTQLMWRAEPFQDFLFFIDLAFPDPLEQQELTGSSQVQFDRIDPLTYAPYVLKKPLPQSPPRRVLMQNGLGDLEVPNLGTFLEARALGVPEIAPNTFPAYLLPQQAAPVAGSALTLWDFGIDLEAVYAVAEPAATNDNPVHEGVRAQPSALAQMNAFFQDGGVIINPCDGGPCYETDAGLDEHLPDGG